MARPTHDNRVMALATIFRGKPAAMADVLAPVAERALPLYEEYQRGATPEARLVKACDKLQLMLKVAVYERWGTGALAEFWDNPDNFPDGGFPAVRELFEALRERRNGSTPPRR